MGITLLALTSGGSPLSGKTEPQLRRAWMRGINVSEELPADLKVLINGLIAYEPQERMNAEGLVRWMRMYGITPDTSETSVSGVQTEKKTEILPLTIGSDVVTDVGAMIRHLGIQWELGCFYLKQKRISAFLRQFGIDEYKLCEKCERLFDSDEGLFILLHTLGKSEDFYWCGIHYDNLADFTDRMLDAQDTQLFQQGAHFLRSNMLVVYYDNLGVLEDRKMFANKIAK